MGHSVMPTTREELAALLSELRTLAGWQALDLGNVSQSWQHYEQGKLAAKEPANPAFDAHTSAGQAFVLLDIGDSAAAVDLMATIRRGAERKTGRLVRSWLAAAHGETLAADGQRSASLRAFDHAAALLPDDAGAGRRAVSRARRRPPWPLARSRSREGGRAGRDRRAHRRARPSRSHVRPR